MEIVVAREPLSSDDARALIAALDAELTALYPEPGSTFLRLDEADAFVIARRTGTPVGCGAMRMLEAGTAEIKRMYVAHDARGAGVGACLLSALESEARALGATRIVLETGPRQPAALGLYRRAGYVEIPPFGEYVGSPLSVCMEKKL
jgi:GNAT superfamily N-acetyltransferase